jgi:hypothetical protein
MEKILNKSEDNNILVTGDFIVDRNLLPGQRRFAADNPNSGTRLVDHFGGSLLTFSLINSINTEYGTKTINCVFDLEEPQLKKFISDYPERTAFSSWTKGKTSGAWNIEEIKGYGFGNPNAGNFSYKRKNLSVQSGWIIIDDGNLGYRNCEEAWPDFTGKKVILKCSFPFHEGKLFQRLIQKNQRPEVLIIIVTIANLRKSDVKIGSDISWEQTALDITAELKRNHKLSFLLKSDHLVVMTGTSAAIHLRNMENAQETEVSLVFDPSHIEGEWEISTPLLPGSGSCFTAAFSQSLIDYCTNKSITSVSIENSINAALLTTRIFCRAGFFPEYIENNKFYKVTDPENKFIKPDEGKFSKAYVTSPFILAKKSDIFSRNKEWSILRGNYLDAGTGDKVEDYIDLACELAIKGSKTLLFAPLMSFGKIVSFDRHEIESFRNIKKLMVDYANNKKSSKPLNIAVFGTPGSGKSFAVKEMSRSFLEKFRPCVMEFNLSQFKDANELSGAFNAIRDTVLMGNLPIVFWDEFDSEALQWLKSLLAPMQDGHFQDGKDTHPIGKSIFIFAGGTSSSFERFDPRNHDDSSTDKAKIDNFVKVKGPDFVSRIHGYLNVCGPNPLQGDSDDVTYPVRRALFLRTGLGLEKEELLDIDYGLLRALLLVKSYNNGARSLDRILTHLKMKGNKKIVRSDLPSDEVINMNTDLDNFYSIMCDDNLETYKDTSELSSFFHDNWLKNKIAGSSSYKEFFMLSNEQRLINISTAGRIKHILAKSEIFALDDRNSDNPDASDEFTTYISLKENIELLAEEEHIRWGEDRKRLGWKKGKTRSDYFKIHPLIDIQYSELSEEDKEKDRKQIRNYTTTLKKSGFKIIKLEQ